MNTQEQREWDAFIGSGVAGNIFLYKIILLPMYKKIKTYFRGKNE